MKKVLKKKAKLENKYYTLLQSRCSCGPCGCVGMCVATVPSGNGGGVAVGAGAGSYNTTYTGIVS